MKLVIEIHTADKPGEPVRARSLSISGDSRIYAVPCESRHIRETVIIEAADVDAVLLWDDDARVYVGSIPSQRPSVNEARRRIEAARELSEEEL